MHRRRVRRIALQRPTQDALQDAGQPEHVEHQVIAPGVGVDLATGLAGALQVGQQVSRFHRNTQCSQIGAAQAAGVGAVGHVPGHAVVSKVDQRVAQRGQLPIEHRQDARLGGVEHHVVQPVIAVHDTGLVVGRPVLRQPVDEGLHRRDLLGLGGTVLLGPALDLALEVAADLAVAVQPHGHRVDPVQRGDDAVQFVVDRAALGRRHARQRRIPQHAALDTVHHVEGGADDRRVFAQHMRPRHRHLGAVQRADDTKLTVHRMRRLQQHAGRLASHHEALAVGGGQPEGRVRLAALELLDLQRAGSQRRHVGVQVGRQLVDIESVLRRHRPGAGELGVGVDGTRGGGRGVGGDLLRHGGNLDQV